MACDRVSPTNVLNAIHQSCGGRRRIHADVRVLDMNAPALPSLKSRVLPVVVIDQAAQAVPLAQALFAAGIDAVEITLRTPAALEAISLITHEVPAMQVGAGTVLSANDLDQVQHAGARFALSPGASPELLRAARTRDIPFIPGVATASEAMAARDQGFRLLKFFPAQALGGTATLRALAGPLQDIQFCPAGGLTAENASAYLALSNVALVGGSWVTPQDAIRSADWSRITALARHARSL